MESSPTTKMEEDEIEITIKVSEGDRYKVGQVDIDGDLIKPKEALLDELKIPNEEYFNRGLLEKDVLHLTDVYGDEGYAYAGVIPRTIPDPRTLTVDVTYAIEKRLKLRNPIYSDTAAYGHMGRTPEIKEVTLVNGSGEEKTMTIETFTWEKLDYVDKVKEAFGIETETMVK